MERLVFDNDSGSSGPRVIVANLAIHFIPPAMFPTNCRSRSAPVHRGIVVQQHCKQLQCISSGCSPQADQNFHKLSLWLTELGLGVLVRPGDSA
eukprot:6073-Heterococcus_DN1.PRE.1